MSAEPASTISDGASAQSAGPTDQTSAPQGDVSSSRVGVDVRRLPWIRPLAGDYAFNFAHVGALYAGDPASPEAWRNVIARSQQHPRRHREMADVLLAQQARRGAPPEAVAAAERLADPKTVAVVTGQQAGAFGGPLYTLLKAITALQLARRTAADHQVPAVAVFWVDAEDHDWEEVRTCTVLDGEFRPRTVTLASPEGAGTLPVTALTLDDRIDDSLDEIEGALASGDFAAWVMGGLHAAYRPGIGMADAFARWIESVLGPYGLIVYESSDPAAKPLASSVFVHELQSPGGTTTAAAAAGQALAALGHDPQVVSQPDSLALFHLDGARRSIRRDGNALLVGETSRSAESLAAEAAAEPGHFSPNVLLRPIVQDTLFPTICYVAGPSELAYLGQLGGVYAQFGIPMPLVHPRASVTLVDSATARFLAKYDLPLDALQPQGETALNKLLQSQLPPEVEESLKEAEQALGRALERVIEAMPAVDATLAGAARTTRSKMEQDLRALQSKVIQAAKRRDDTMRRQFMHAQVQVFPQGHPQERTLAVIYFLNRYGPALVDRLLEELPLEFGHHWVMTI